MKKKIVKAVYEAVSTLYFFSRIRENISTDSKTEKYFTESAKNNPRRKWKTILAVEVRSN